MDGLTGSLAPRRRVRVWFGSHPITEHVAEPAAAERFEAAMRQRFASLRVTNEPAGASSASGREPEVSSALTDAADRVLGQALPRWRDDNS